MQCWWRCAPESDSRCLENAACARRGRTGHAEGDGRARPSSENRQKRRPGCEPRPRERPQRATVWPGRHPPWQQSCWPVGACRVPCRVSPHGCAGWRQRTRCLHRPGPAVHPASVDAHCPDAVSGRRQGLSRGRHGRSWAVGCLWNGWCSAPGKESWQGLRARGLSAR